MGLGTGLTTIGLLLPVTNVEAREKQQEEEEAEEKVVNQAKGPEAEAQATASSLKANDEEEEIKDLDWGRLWELVQSDRLWLFAAVGVSVFI